MEFGSIQQQGAGQIPRQVTSGANELSTVSTLLSRLRLPATLKRRLAQDSLRRDHYQALGSIDELKMKPANTSYFGRVCGCCMCNTGILVETGHVGLFQENDDFFFLEPGQHAYSLCGTKYFGQKPLQTYNQPVTNGQIGFITITEGHIGVMVVAGEYRLLPPGVYQWDSAAVSSVTAVSVVGAVCALGPYTLVTVPDGEAAITYHHGDIHVLGGPAVIPTGSIVRSEDGTPAPVLQDGERRNVKAPARPPAPGYSSTAAHDDEFGSGENDRSFFLDDPRWKFHCFLQLTQQTDRLEGNDLLSKDNVEVLMVAMSHWRIIDPKNAAVNCGSNMEIIRRKVDSLVRATIARIVAGTLLGRGPVSGATSTIAVGVQAEPAEGDTCLAEAMLSDSAQSHMEELSRNMERMGVEVIGVYIPEKRIKNNDTRRAVAAQAVIGIQAEAQRSAADANAYTMLINARAKANAIRVVSDAQTEAGNLLGTSDTTASRLALSEAMGKTLNGSKMTVFTGNPEQLPFMFTDQANIPAAAAARRMA